MKVKWVYRLSITLVHQPHYMISNFTNNLLVKYIYNETTAAEKFYVEEALNENFELYEEYEALYEAYIGLPKVKFSPSPDTLSNILQYSKASKSMVLR